MKRTALPLALVTTNLVVAVALEVSRLGAPAWIPKLPLAVCLAVAWAREERT